MNMYWCVICIVLLNVYDQHMNNFDMWTHTDTIYFMSNTSHTRTWHTQHTYVYLYLTFIYILHSNLLLFNSRNTWRNLDIRRNYDVWPFEKRDGGSSKIYFHEIYIEIEIKNKLYRDWWLNFNSKMKIYFETKNNPKNSDSPFLWKGRTMWKLRKLINKQFSTRPAYNQ
jgi:hypothetical protein